MIEKVLTTAEIAAISEVKVDRLSVKGLQSEMLRCKGAMLKIDNTIAQVLERYDDYPRPERDRYLSELGQATDLYSNYFSQLLCAAAEKVMAQSRFDETDTNIKIISPGDIKTFLAFFYGNQADSIPSFR